MDALKSSLSSLSQTPLAPLPTHTNPIRLPVATRRIEDDK